MDSDSCNLAAQVILVSSSGTHLSPSHLNLFNYNPPNFPPAQCCPKSASSIPSFTVSFAHGLSHIALKHFYRLTGSAHKLGTP